jgi:hypothetical protein
MNTALADIAGVTDSPPHKAERSKFPVGANVLSLQARRDLRQSVLAGNSEGLHVESHRDTRRLNLLLTWPVTVSRTRSFGLSSRQ